jgi:hypothetical protein
MAHSRKSRPATAVPSRATQLREPEPEGPAAGRGSTEELLSRGERRKLQDDQLRASLRPLGDDELPGALKVAIAIAVLAGIGNLVAGLAGLEIDGQKPALSGVVGFSGIILFAAWGMWRKRYWAVLGFQCLLGIVVVIFALFLLRASNVGGVLVGLFFVIAPGWLFWKLVRVLARMQVPERPGAGERVP